MGQQRRVTYLIQDPYDFDALEFIRTIDARYGYRPVCFYFDAKARYYGEQQFPELTGDRIERAYDVAPDQLGSFVAEVTSEYDVLGVVPYREDTVEIAAEMLAQLGDDWNTAETLRRFRDKHELKRHVEAIDPTVRVPAHRRVTTADELSTEPMTTAFVVKPNDGFGNMLVGVFQPDQVDEAMAHIAAHPGVTWIIEEYIGGTEYHVDGFVRQDGEVRALAVFEYVRAEVNGYPTVYLGEVTVGRHDPVFAEAAGYAERLLHATGLRSCPFHLEVKIDESGPCVIDLGARFLSESGSLTLTRLHPTLPSAHAVAAAFYLSQSPPDDHIDWPNYDWSAYDDARTVLVYGVSTEEGTISSLCGLDDVEALPEFVRWAVRPRVGDQLTATNDLRGAPYIVELSCRGDRLAALGLMDDVRAMISWNHDATTATRLTAEARRVGTRAMRKARWLVHRGAAGSARVRS